MKTNNKCKMKLIEDPLVSNKNHEKIPKNEKSQEYTLRFGRFPV